MPWLPLLFTLCVLLCAVSASPTGAAPAPHDSTEILATLKPSHPRLLVSDSSWEEIKARRRQDAALDAFLKRGEAEARALLSVSPVPYEKRGKRLLQVSRTVLRRTLLLALHFQLSGDKALLKRAQQEMLHAAAFADPRPAQPLSDNQRLLPLAALWWPAAQDSPSAPDAPRFWLGRGPNPLAVFRESWNDKNAMFLALKGGRASLSHGHMDAGSFVFESDGVRWARDLGMQDYLSLESKGVALFSRAQNGARWSVFRLNNFSHNTLTINDQLHQANGQAQITHFSNANDAGAIVDLTPVFAGQASRVTRSFKFLAGCQVEIRDEIEGLKTGDTVRWAMLTSAQIALSPDGLTATLSQSGKILRVELSSAVEAKFEVISADPPLNDYDAPNPNLRFLLVNLTAPAAGQLNWSVALRPTSAASGHATGAATPELLARVELGNGLLPAAPEKLPSRGAISWRGA